KKPPMVRRPTSAMKAAAYVSSGAVRACFMDIAPDAAHAEVGMVPLAGLEPARCFHHLILSQARLPIPPQGPCALGIPENKPGAHASGADHSGARRGVNRWIAQVLP